MKRRIEQDRWRPGLVREERALVMPWESEFKKLRFIFELALFFEMICIQLLMACQKKRKVCELMNLSFDELNHIQRRAV
ncbi:MAG: hypothetical protein PF795_08800, partial [Kiritimatiellae bacterium]|nr:hypothetical protein [Kiritimatiellia bacterium]